jgi:methionyl-tRNA formyltransferase
LKRLVEVGYDVALVVTQPDRPGGRGMKSMSPAVKVLASGLGLVVYQPERIKERAAQDRVRQLGADVMVVVAYGQILPRSLLDSPRLGTLNVHGSILPRHRGPAPVEWSILSGDAATGVTIMQMDAGVDTGPILAQATVPIAPDETAPQLEGRLAELGASLMVETLERLQRGDITPVPQPAEGATHAPRLTSVDGKLSPATMSAQEIDRRVRALSQRLGCWMKIKDVDLKVIGGHVAGDVGDGIPVSTMDGVYVVDEVQPPGGRPMHAAAWMRGRR